MPLQPGPSKTMENPSSVNDFSIEVATVNGSGSQTANIVLMRTIFQMGVPVTGKNLFPANLAGARRGTMMASHSVRRSNYG